jgi:hypothetical protein
LQQRQRGASETKRDRATERQSDRATETETERERRRNRLGLKQTVSKSKSKYRHPVCSSNAGLLQHLRSATDEMGGRVFRRDVAQGCCCSCWTVSRKT